MLSAFTFSPAKDPENNDIDVRYAQLSEPGFLMYVHNVIIVFLLTSLSIFFLPFS
ncbi:MAG TPA: hypothetical protein VGO47_12360 [Chlamydiales bacterium]|nr:hypothetical protein [Chlamydiales bacterium]